MMLFHEYLNKFMQVYLDDFSVYGKRSEHIGQLRLCFSRCREGRVCLNPEKCSFLVSSGKLLGHIVCQQGILVDPDKVEVIRNMPAPRHATEVRRFLGSGGFYQRYIKGHSAISAPLSKLTSTHETFQWSPECQKAFEEIKERLSQAPILKEPDWGKEFHLHTDASLIAVGAVLAQQGEEGIDSPVYYASRLLNVHERNYTTTEREALAMIFAVKKFRHYLLGNKFVFFVDHNALVNLVNKPQLSGRIGRWILLLSEFDYTVMYKPGRTHVVPDYLSRLESGEAPSGIDDQLPDMSLYLNEDNTESGSVEDNLPGGSEITLVNPEQENQITGDGRPEREPEVWQVVVTEGPELEHYLRTAEFPEGLSRKDKGVYSYKARPYTLMDGVLYYRGADDILRRVLMSNEQRTAMEMAHDGFGGGHFGADITVRKILQQGLWWKTMHKDTHDYVKTCDACQRLGPIKESMEFRPVIAPYIFQKWGMDFIGPIHPMARYSQNQYILAATEYTTKWVEAIATRENTARVTAKFLYQNIITRYGLPGELVSDQGTHFMNSPIQELTTNYNIRHRFSTPYYPQCNGQVESTNKILLNTLRKNWAAFFHASFVTAVKRASRVVKNNEELDVELATHIRILLAGQSSLEKVLSPVTPTRKGKGKAARLPAKEQENSEDDSFEEPVPVPTQKKMEGQRRSNRRQLGKEEKVGKEMDSKNRYPGKKGDPAGKSSKRSVVIETESSEEEESESTEEVEVPISRRPLMKKRNGIRVISQREEIAPSSPEESLDDETTEEDLKPAADSDQEIKAVGLDEGQDESKQETSEESESEMNGETDDSEAEGDSDNGEEPVAELECKKTLTVGKSLAQEERLTSVESDSEKGRVLMVAGNKADQGDSHTGLKKPGRDLVEEAKPDDLEAHKKELSPEFSKLEKHAVEETLGDLLRKKSAVWKEECQSVMGAQIEGFITHVLDEVTQGGQLTVLTQGDGKKQSKKGNSPGEGRVDKETTSERDALEKLMESLGMKTKDLEVTQSEMASWWGKVATVVQDVVTENQKLKMKMQQPTCQEKPKEM
ncbi:unnamed protein product [Calypogeia fissa]